MTNFEVPVWGYWIMGLGFAAFFGLPGFRAFLDRG